MTAKNNIPKGYKYSAMGIIPQEWEVKYLGDLLSRLANGLTYDVSVTSGYPVSRIETISSGEINYSKVGYIDNVVECELYKMQKGDILYSHINSLAHVGKVAYYDGKQELYHGINLLLMRVNDMVDSNYLYAYMLTSQAKHIAQVIAKPAVNQASISINDIRKIKLPVPPLEEQRKIAEILSVWDEVIEKQCRLIERLEERKRALMQRLLTGRMRIHGFNTPWQKVKLGEICKRVTRRNEENCQNVMTISAKRGFVSQTDFFNKSVASSILDNYYLVLKDEFCYNKSYSNGYPMGAIKRLKETEKAVVTTLYICFGVANSKRLNINFFEQYCEYGGLNRGLTKVANEGGRAHGLLNVTPSDFFGLKLLLPSLEEQKAIAEMLATADNEIVAHRKKLDSLRMQKRGLMQQLLTGKIRVKK